MYPLMIVGRLGKCVDAILTDNHPIARGDLLANHGAEFGKVDMRHDASV
jgi:hypothetical protein